MVKVWITIVGLSPFAVINSVWAAAKNWTYVPERVYLLKSGQGRITSNCEMCEAWLRNIISRYSLDVSALEIIIKEFDESSFRELTRKVDEILRNECLEGNEVMLDITPGRKFMSIILFNSGIKYKDKGSSICYMHLHDEKYLNCSLPMIPSPEYDLISFLKKDG